jgi:hypothetical protein
MAVTAPRAQEPAACVTDTLYSAFPARWVGTLVGSMAIRPQNVDTPGGFATSAVNRLHVPTHSAVIWNDLDFAPGQPVDSIAILESVRRLRRSPLYSEVLLEGTRCEGSEETSFVLWTRDAWSLRGGLKLASVGPSRIALAELNLFGTGRTLALAQEAVDVRRSFSIGFSDPSLFGTRLRGNVLARLYEDGRAWNWGVRTRDFGPFDRWRFAFQSSQQRRVKDDTAHFSYSNVERRRAAFVASRRLFIAPTGVWALVGGVERERANLAVFQPGPTIGRPELYREFTAPVLGVARRSTIFRAVNWLVERQSPTEVPVGVDGEVVASVGREQNTGARLTHLDGWIGGTAMLGSNTIITADAWSSGYWNSDSVSNGALRLAGAIYRNAKHGMWIVRGASERIYNPDPDVFALSTTDPMLRSLAPNAGRLAESALLVSVERAFHLYEYQGRWGLDGALFASYSQRHGNIDPNADDPHNLFAWILGAGLRRVRNQATQPPLRIDVGRAVSRSALLGDRWIVVISTVPWINAGRQRDGLRDTR